MATKYNFTFIIPHKNIPDLLMRCVSSIPRRDDVQIIVVDDNSDPGKVNFDHFPFKDDPSVEIVYDKSGKGAGHARNIGLEKATGKWLVFADADDYYLYSINKALDDYKDSSSDLIFFPVQNIDGETYIPAKKPRSYNYYIDQCLAGRPNAELDIRLCYRAPWAKFYKKSLIDDHNVKFDETFKANDIRFGYVSGYYAEKIQVDKRAIYCLTNRSNSLSTIYSPEACVLISDVYCKCLDFLKINNVTNTIAYKNNYWGVINLLEILKKTDSNRFHQVLKMLNSRGFSNFKLRKDILMFKLKNIAKKIIRK